MAIRLLVLCSIAGSLFTATSFQANAAERGVFRIGGIVPTVCRLDIGGAAPAQSGTVLNLGSFKQVCNSKAGYRVIMQHPANMVGAALTIDGRVVPLSTGNETVIVDENRPVFKVSDAQLDMRNVTFPLNTLSFRIEPKGAIY